MILFVRESRWQSRITTESGLDQRDLFLDFCAASCALLPGVVGYGSLAEVRLGQVIQISLGLEIDDGELLFLVEFGFYSHLRTLLDDFLFGLFVLCDADGTLVCSGRRSWDYGLTLSIDFLNELVSGLGCSPLDNLATLFLLCCLLLTFLLFNNITQIVIIDSPVLRVILIVVLITNP